jgi:hypothetical protein
MNTIQALALTFFASVCAGCATTSRRDVTYDPDAKETLGRVTAKVATGHTTKQQSSTTPTLMPIVGVPGVPLLLIPVSVSTDRNGPSLPVFEYKVELEDGRQVSVFSWYVDHSVGGCVKLFESPTNRRDYPRMINAGGCK